MSSASTLLGVPFNLFLVLNPLSDSTATAGASEVDIIFSQRTKLLRHRIVCQIPHRIVLDEGLLELSPDIASLICAFCQDFDTVT